jgi:hypothetical protein
VTIDGTPHIGRALGWSRGNGQPVRIYDPLQYPALILLSICSPMRLKQSEHNETVCARLSAYPDIKQKTLPSLRQQTQSPPCSRRLFGLGNSFPTTTINFGPQTVYYDHLDTGNKPAGWCEIRTMLQRGHLILFDWLNFPHFHTLGYHATCQYPGPPSNHMKGA